MTTCPVCDSALADSITLASSAAGDAVTTRICGGCTLALTGTVAFALDAGYRARACSDDVALRYEADDGSVQRLDLAGRTQLAHARAQDLLRAVAALRSPRRVRVLQIGGRDVAGIQTLAADARVNAVALEPWLPWARTARSSGVEVQSSSLERWRARGRFDLVVESDVLPHLADPVAHLEGIAKRLSATGVALIEVPNLLQAVGIAADDVLSAVRRCWFTPRALATACRRAGLAPFFMVADDRLRVWCRRAAPQAGVVPGPTAQEVAEAVWGNDLRVQLKRALAKVGGTATAMRMAAAIHARCTHAAVRADLALEIANAAERSSDLETAATWLATSLQDRRDPAVVAMLERVHALRDRVGAMWAAMPAANDPMPNERFRLPS